MSAAPPCGFLSALPSHTYPDAAVGRKCRFPCGSLRSPPFPRFLLRRKRPLPLGAQHLPPQRGAPLTLRAAPTGAANSLPPAGAERGAQGSPNCAKAVFCAPLRGLQLALFGGCDLARPRPAAARCLPAEKGELRQIPTFAPPLRGFTIRAELSRDRAAMAANLQQLAFVERGRLPL